MDVFEQRYITLHKFVSALAGFRKRRDSRLCSGAIPAADDDMGVAVRGAGEGLGCCLADSRGAAYEEGHGEVGGGEASVGCVGFRERGHFHCVKGEWDDWGGYM